TDWRRPELLVPSVRFPRISVLPVLSLTDDRRISAIQRIIHPRVQRVVEVLVVDDSGRALLAITRVAQTARRDDDFSDALPVLALLALLALVALLPVVSRDAVLSATDHRGISVTERVIHPCVRRVVEVLVVDDRGGTLLAVTRVALTARRDDRSAEHTSVLQFRFVVVCGPLLEIIAMVPLVALRP